MTRSRGEGEAGGQSGNGPSEDPMFSLAKAKILGVTGGAVLLLDLVTKAIVERTFFLGQSVPVLGDFLRLTYIINPGAAFGIHVGEYSRILLVVLASLALVFLMAVFFTTPVTDSFRLYSVGLIAGGATGNLLDRLRSPFGVIDFLDIGIGNVRWPIFNVADIAITVGAILLVLSIWREDSANERASEHE